MSNHSGESWAPLVLLLTGAAIVVLFAFFLDGSVI